MQYTIEVVYWKRKAACIDTDPDVFFPMKRSYQAVREIRQVCDGCPVRTECTQSVLDHQDENGWWAGKPTADIHKLAARGMSAFQIQAK